jgi:hypothetical protein
MTRDRGSPILVPSPRSRPSVGRADATLVKYAEKIRTLLRRSGRDVIEIGRLLKDARKRLAHGEWLPWLQGEFRLSPDTAERFIHVHERFGKYRNMRNLPPPTVLYELAKPSTPEAARTEIMRRAEAGERITTKEAMCIPRTVTVGVGRTTKGAKTVTVEVGRGPKLIPEGGVPYYKDVARCTRCGIMRAAARPNVSFLHAHTASKMGQPDETPHARD